MTLDKFEIAQRKYNFVAWLAAKHHKTHKKEHLDFSKHQYQRDIYYDKHEYVVIIKSTQNGISEYLLCRSIAHAINGMRVFYVLPTFELVKRFVDERYTKSVQNTPYYYSLEKAIKEELEIKQTQSVKSKDIGNGNIAYVNSYSSVGFTEYPADEVIIDELDKCDPVNIKMAEERLAHSDYRWQIKISNPTYKGLGIDAEFKETDRMQWFSTCQGGHRVRIRWFDHIVREVDKGEYVIRDEAWNWNSNRDIYAICDKCGKPIDRYSEGVWVPERESRKRGRQLTKLFSGTVPLVDILDRFSKALYDDELMQRVYNADFGEAYTAEGAKITHEMLDACVGTIPNGDDIEGHGIMGIDVGSVLNIVIGKIRQDGVLQIVYIGTAQTKESEIQTLWDQYNVKVGVIDAMPELSFSKKVSAKHSGMFRCWYSQSKKDPVDKYKNVTVDRTSSLDDVKSVLLTKSVVLPINSASVSAFYDQMTAATRIFEKEANKGNGAYRWEEGNTPDHYHHAFNYLLIAKKLLVQLSKYG